VGGSGEDAVDGGQVVGGSLKEAGGNGTGGWVAGAVGLSNNRCHPLGGQSGNFLVDHVGVGCFDVHTSGTGRSVRKKIWSAGVGGTVDVGALFATFDLGYWEETVSWVGDWCRWRSGLGLLCGGKLFIEDNEALVLAPKKLGDIRIGAYLKKFLMISVVIPVRDARALLERCLESLDRQTVDRSDYEVIVVDDGSTDGSAEVARKWGARVFRQEKKGAGAARNRGIQEAKGEVLLFLDADCEADGEWMARISEPIGKDATSGTVGRFTSDQENWVARLIQIEIEGRYHQMSQYDRIDFVNTATCGFRRELLLNNHFDESFQKLEDVELSFRIAQKGSRLVYVPGATVRHSHPESLYAYLKRTHNKKPKASANPAQALRD